LATRRTARPIGAGAGDAVFGGTLDGCAPSFPGCVGYPAGACLDQPEPAASTGRALAAGAWISFDVSTLPTGEALPARARGSLRIIAASDNDGDYSRLEFDTTDQARQAATLVANHPLVDERLRELSARTGANQVEWLAEQLHAGRLKILWRLREPPIRPQAAAPVRPPAPAPRAIPTTRATAVPDSTFPPDLDAAAVAQSLKDAAADGVPFCEECMKAQARENATAGAA
jgi:hypothetical protein